MRKNTMKLIEIKVIEPASVKGWSAPRLDGGFDHPARVRYINAWLNSDGTFTPVGSEGRWRLDRDDYCPDYHGNLEAWLVGEIDASRYMEADRFEAL